HCRLDARRRRGASRGRARCPAGEAPPRRQAALPEARPIIAATMADLGEFELIDRFFTRPTRRATLGVGDDCALLQPTAGTTLAVSTDMLVEGRHFLPTVAPERLGHKPLAVSLSDLAACGARPVAFTLALALPR